MGGAKEYDSDAAASDPYDHVDHPDNDILNNASGYTSPPEVDVAKKGYAILEFPDSYYYLHDSSIIIGRNTYAERLHKQKQEHGIRDFYPEILKLETEGRQLSPGADEWAERVSDPGNGHITLEGGTGGPQSSRHHSVELEDNEEFIAVHPPADFDDDGVFHFKGISKRHLRIKLDEYYEWTLDILGRNGAYVNQDYHPRGVRVLLEDKDIITISSLPIRFHISDVPQDEYESDSSEELSGAEEQDAQVSVDGMVEDVDELMEGTLSAEENGLLSDADENDEDGAEAATPLKRKIKLKLSDPRPVKQKLVLKQNLKGGKSTSDKTKKESEDPSADRTEDPPKRRGPGRPPADGVMSKRERREREKAAKAGVEYGDPIPVKPKGRHKTNTPNEGAVGEEEDGSAIIGDDAISPTTAADQVGEKAVKSKKRKRSELDGQENTESPDKKAEQKQPPEPPAPPRSPTPKEEDYPPEALLKPERTYHSLLHEILSDSKEPLALPQIYKIIRRKWPYFQFRIGGSGWESSVRHNLGNNDHFMTAGKAGKGYYWTINPDVPFEPKVKRTSDQNRVVPYYPTSNNGTPTSSSVPRPQPTFRPIPQQPLPGPPGGRPTNLGTPPMGYSTVSNANLQASGQPRPVHSNPTANLQQPYSPYNQQQPSNVGTAAPGAAQHNNQTQFRPQQTPLSNNVNQMSTQTPVRATGAIPGTVPQNGYRAPATPNSGAATIATGSPATNSTTLTAHQQPAYQRPTTYTSAQGTSSLPPRQTPQSTSTPPANIPASLQNHMTQRRLTAFEQLERGEVPRVFQRFKDTLGKSAADQIEANHLRMMAENAIKWIVSHPRPNAEVDARADPSIKAIIKILRDLLVEDWNASGSRGTHMASNNNSNSSTPAAGHHTTTPQTSSMQTQHQRSSPAVQATPGSTTAPGASNLQNTEAAQAGVPSRPPSNPAVHAHNSASPTLSSSPVQPEMKQAAIAPVSTSTSRPQSSGLNAQSQGRGNGANSSPAMKAAQSQEPAQQAPASTTVATVTSPKSAQTSGQALPAATATPNTASESGAGTAASLTSTSIPDMPDKPS